VAEIVSDGGWEALEEMQLHLPRLQEVLKLYLRFGGLPAAVAEAIGGRTAPSEATKKLVYDSLLREIQRKHVWQTRRAGEIDFVCGPRRAADAVEVKYQSNPDLRGAASIPRALPGRAAIVVTQDRHERRRGYALVPAPLFLWALG
jgi:predicted AAA+ superfamily ATPase